MIINHNMNAMNAHRQMGANTAANGKSIEKLSSGLRINRAGDDAAGLAISEKMRGQIRGLDMASKNAQDGISLIQTAEGALNETHSILQRMRELSVQASNDTNTSDDRAEIQKEIEQLTSEIDRIGNTTEFNTKKLLNGGAGLNTTVTGAEGAAIQVVGGTADTLQGATVTMTSITAAVAASKTVDLDTSTLNGAGGTLGINGVSINIQAGWNEAQIAQAINGVSASTGVTATYDDTNNTFTISTIEVGSGASMTLSGFDTTFSGGTAENNTVDVNAADAIIVTSEAGDSFTAKGNVITMTSGNAKGLEFRVDSTKAGTWDGTTATNNNATVTVDSNNSLAFQIGANEGQTMDITIGDMRSTSLGVDGVDVTTKPGAESAVKTINDALALVSSERSKLGAYQNRLEHTINNLGTSSENLTAAESRIRDVDMAKEMMTFSKTNILSQAAQAMLAQANQQPQGVLQLLR